MQIGDPRLKAKNAKVARSDEPRIKQVINDLIETMRAENLIGMAAPQIGENYQIFVTEPRKTIFRSGVFDALRVYINPKIVRVSPETMVAYEGCGSVEKAGRFGRVSRPREVTVEARDEKGEKFRLRADGILARVIQHEMDHLKGVEFVDKVARNQVLVSFETYVEMYRNSPEQLKAAEITVCEAKRLG